MWAYDLLLHCVRLIIIYHIVSFSDNDEELGAKKPVNNKTEDQTIQDSNHSKDAIVAKKAIFLRRY